ncbi:MAG: hypothetical protein QF492_08015 [Candidatus Krumholzibacteria bacterium]|jgi:hypothetical protein|nr:hypothetical protein [Candidatus Krumholzibacteria bacterium]MDP6669832.1 hypothetical protein [Candidatus Krumholzibacteria bacterium]MDP6798136.1 hypothetical protein [Candidatus Krumholzibacteria bacterium]MDP7022231.1 hypothetical protein [Candidatus Krumholzibacteria bacterium]
MLKKLMLTLVVLAASTAIASANTLTIDGLVLPGNGTNVTLDRLGLINDGSFENGECDAGSSWTCYTNTSCLWIIDPLGVWGYPAYDGVLCGWLGGFCGDANSNAFCQDIFIDGTGISWYWMGYVADTVDGLDLMYISVDGVNTFEHYMVYPDDHTYGTWGQMLGTVTGVGGVHELCFGFTASTGANMLIDYIELFEGTGVMNTSFSSVKSLY